jgi:hypothetical protein
VLVANDGVDKERVAPWLGNVGRVVTPVEGDRSARPAEKLGNRAFGSAYLPKVDLVLALGAVILRTSKDHEVAVRVGEGVPVLGRRSLLLGRLLVAVSALAEGVVRGDVQELAGGARLSTAELVNEGLAGGSSEEHADDICVDDVR